MISIFAGVKLIVSVRVRQQRSQSENAWIDLPDGSNDTKENLTATVSKLIVTLSHDVIVFIFAFSTVSCRANNVCVCMLEKWWKTRAEKEIEIDKHLTLIDWQKPEWTMWMTFKLSVVGRTRFSRKSIKLIYEIIDTERWFWQMSISKCLTERCQQYREFVHIAGRTEHFDLLSQQKNKSLLTICVCINN